MNLHAGAGTRCCFEKTEREWGELSEEGREGQSLKQCKTKQRIPKPLGGASVEQSGLNRDNPRRLDRIKKELLHGADRNWNVRFDGRENIQQRSSGRGYIKIL